MNWYNCHKLKTLLWVVVSNYDYASLPHVIPPTPNHLLKILVHRLGTPRTNKNKTQYLMKVFRKTLFLQYFYWIKNLYKGDKSHAIPASIYLLKVNNRNTKTRCEIYSKLTIKTPEPRSGVFSFNSKHISQPALVLLLLTLNM